MSQYQLDLLNIESHTVSQINSPYSIIHDSWETCAQKVYNLMRQQMTNRNRIMTMVYAYYLGEIIDLSVTPHSKWQEFIHQNHIRNEYHYYLGATRTYRLFEGNIQ